MTELFARVPVWLFLDGGVRALPAPARVALYELAANGGSARCGDDPAAVLDGLCAGAGALLPVMLYRGVVALDGARIVLMAPDGTPSSVGAARPASAPPPPPAAPSPFAPRRTDDRAAVQRLGALWSKDKLATYEARVAWLDSPAGARFLAREGRDRAWVLDLAARNPGVNRGRFGQRVDTAPASTAASTAASTVDRVDRNHGVNHGVNLALPPAPPLPQKNEEGSEGNPRTRGVNPGVNLTDGLTVNHGVNLAASTPGVGGFTLADAEEVLHTIRARSDGRFSTRYANGQLQRFHALCADLIARGTTRAEIERVGDHIRHGGMDWSKRPDVGALLAEAKDNRGPQLPRVLSDIDACPQCGGEDASRVGAEDPWQAAAAKKGVRL